MYTKNGRYGHSVLDLEAIGARFGDLQRLIDRQVKGVATVFQLRLPLPVGIFQVKFVAFAAIGRVVGIKNGENQRNVIIGIFVGETDAQGQIIGGGFLNLNIVSDIIKTLPKGFVKIAMD